MEREMLEVGGRRSELPECLPHPLTCSRQVNLSAEHASTPDQRAFTEKLEFPHPFDLVIPEEAFQLTSTTVEELREALDLHKKANRARYLWVPCLNQSAFEIILREPDLFKSFRATICLRTSEIVYKMVGGRHEQLSRRFESLISYSLSTMSILEISDHFEWLGAARYKGKWCFKEPDSTFVPGKVDVNAGWVPSLIVETGYSESVSQLRTDARWWYSNTEKETKIIILIHAGKKPTWNLTVEVWQEVNVHERPSTRGCPSQDLQCTQSVCVTNNGVLGGEIVIDFSLLMRRPPRHPIENDIVLNAGLLQRLA